MPPTQPLLPPSQAPPAADSATDDDDDGEWPQLEPRALSLSVALPSSASASVTTAPAATAVRSPRAARATATRHRTTANASFTRTAAYPDAHPAVNAIAAAGTGDALPAAAAPDTATATLAGLQQLSFPARIHRLLECDGGRRFAHCLRWSLDGRQFLIFLEGGGPASAASVATAESRGDPEAKAPPRRGPKKKRAAAASTEPVSVNAATFGTLVQPSNQQQQSVDYDRYAGPFARHCLRPYFNHSKFQSFIRTLSQFGFHRTTMDLRAAVTGKLLAAVPEVCFVSLE